VLINQRNSWKPPGKRKTGRRPGRSRARRRTSVFETTARTPAFGTSRRRSRSRKTGSFLGGLLARPQKAKRPHGRRSATRLAHTEIGRQRRSARRGLYEATAPAVRVVSQAKKALRFNGKALVNVLFLGLVGWGLAWLFVSDQFYVYQVAVTGNQRVSAEAIARASGVLEYSIFWVNPRRAAARIVEALPPIRRARVEYGLPNEVTLVVEEEGEQVMWEVAGKRYWVDDGGALHPADEGTAPRLLIKDVRPEPPDKVDIEAVRAARQLAYLLPDLETVDYAPLTGLRFVHPRGWQVYLGTGDDMAAKVSVLKAMESRFAAEDAAQPSLVDLRFPESPYYRFADEGSGGR
jgi:cell division septal protein FtsQ